MNSPKGVKDSLSQLEEELSISWHPHILDGCEPSGPPHSSPVECPPPPDQELSLLQQLENLAGRKSLSHQGKPHPGYNLLPWGKAGSREAQLKPLWLSPEKPLDWREELPSGDVIGKGPGGPRPGIKAPT